MPLKVWSQEDGALVSRILTNWTSTSVKESFRPEAEVFDLILDSVLDQALAYSEQEAAGGRSEAFAKAWSIGRALDVDALTAHTAMRGEETRFLWMVLASKCRLGARSSGSHEPRWQSLRPGGAVRQTPPRREERGRLDYFDMCVWLASDPFDVVAETFGSSVRNAWQMFERPTLRVPAVRHAVYGWLRELAEADRQLVLSPQAFASLMKALRVRWPARGPGSARQPVHMPESEVRSAVRATGRTVLETLESRG